MRAHQQLREDYARFLATTPKELSSTEIERLRETASDIATLWTSTTTSHADRKEIVRCVIDRVIVCVQDKSEYADVTIVWHGGFTSQHEVTRPVFDVTHQRDYDRLVSRIKELHSSGLTCMRWRSD